MYDYFVLQFESVGNHRLSETIRPLENVQLAHLYLKPCSDNTIFFGFIYLSFDFLFFFQFLILRRYDFYLVSNYKSFGTAAPTYYHVVLDTLKNWSPDKMHNFTFKLTHLYFNRMVSIPRVRYRKKPYCNSF